MSRKCHGCGLDFVPSEFKGFRARSASVWCRSGSLERHGEHIPFGCDVVIAETLCELAAQRTPCVVSGSSFGRVQGCLFHGNCQSAAGACSGGVLQGAQGIAENGFTKIAIVNGHGGNSHFLEYFCMSQMDEARSYVLYVINAYHSLNEQEEKDLGRLWETPIFGHADELETSLYMACRPGLTRLGSCRRRADAAVRSIRSPEAAGRSQRALVVRRLPAERHRHPARRNRSEGSQGAGDHGNGGRARACTIKDDQTAPTLQREWKG